MDLDDAGLPRVGLVGGASFLHQTCQEALDGVAVVRRVDVRVCDDPLALDAVLIATNFLLDHGVRWLERSRAWNGKLPIVLLCSREHADVCDVLLRFLVDDIVPIADIPTDLRPHLAALLDGSGRGRSFVSPPLLEAAHFRENRRRCYRARPPAGTATAIATLAGFEIELGVHDLSIAARGAAGGMRLGCDPEVAPPFELIAPGQLLPLRLQLPDAVAPVTVQAGLVAGTVRRDAASVYFAARYTAHDPVHKKRIRSFWVRCQRLADWLPE